MAHNNGDSALIDLDPSDPRVTPAAFLRNRLSSESGDPATSLNGMAPNFGRPVIPHIVSFQSLVGSGRKVYRDYDEATKASLDNARFMRNDCGIMECIESRQRCVSLLDWHLEPEDEKSHEQVELCAELTKIVNRIRLFTEYRYNLMSAIWYGKYAVQNRYGWQEVGGKQYLIPTGGHADDIGWQPINGDKLVFRYDDGHLPAGAFANQLGIRIGSTYAAGDLLAGRWRVEMADRSMAYFLSPWERKLISVHRHLIEDAAFEDAISAGSINGVGIRSRIYWEWVQKQETLAFLMEYLERSAGGIEMWKYPMGNATAKAETERAARERLGGARNVVMIPMPMDDTGQYGLQVIEPGMAGIETVHQLLTEYFGHRIKRYILGQILTSEAATTGLGSGVAEAHKDTFMQIVRFDAMKLQETLTHELVRHVKDFNFPKAKHIHVELKIDVEEEDVKEKLESYQMAYNMGCSLKERDVMDMIGASIPGPDDNVLKQQEPAMEPGMPGAGGMPTGGIAPAAAMTAGQFEQAFHKGKPGDDSAGGGDGDVQPGSGPVSPGDAGERVKVGEYARDVSQQPRDEQGRWINPESQSVDSNDAEDEDEDDAPTPHKFSSTQFDIENAGYARAQGSPLDVMRKLAEQIDEADLAEDGREDHPHITIKYGLHADEPGRLREIVDGFGPVRVRFGKVSLFQNDEHDVVKVDIEGDDIYRLNRLITAEMECTDTHPTYKPHATLAYVKTGRGEKYTGTSDLTGMECFFTEFDFSAKDRTLTAIDLIGTDYADTETEHYARRAKLKPSARQKQLIGDQQQDLHWITLHGGHHGDGEGSVHVQVDGRGNIHAGPAGLAEKGITKLSDFGKKDKPEGADETPTKAAKPKPKTRKIGGEHQPGLFEPDEELGGQRLLGLVDENQEASQQEPANTKDATPRSKFRVLGITDDKTTCELCGKPSLRNTVALDVLDDEGNATGEIVHYGRDCASKVLHGDKKSGNIRSVESLAKGISYAKKWLGRSAKHTAAVVANAVRVRFVDASAVGDSIVFPNGVTVPTANATTQGAGRNTDSAEPDDTAPSPEQPTGPKDGDRNADGLVFRDGRWHREGEQQAAQDEPTAKEASPDESGPMSLEKLQRRQERLHAGEATAAEVKQWYNEARDPANLEAIKAELNKKSVAELKKMGAQGFYGREKKADLIESLLNGVGEEYHIGQSGVSFQIGGPGYVASKEAAYRKAIESQTDEDIKSHADRIASQRAEYKARRDAYIKSVENPETLEDFDKLARVKGGEENLTPEQQRQYDELRATSRRKKSAEEAAKKASVSGFEGGEQATGGIGIVEGHHQKRNAPTFTVTVENHLGDKWDEALSRAKRLGGSYVNARIAKAYNATPGFQFFDKDKAEQFANVLRGESVDRTEDFEKEQAERAASRAASLQDRGADIVGAGESDLNRDRKDNTARRAAMAASAESSARAKIATGKTLQAIGEKMEAGDLKHLGGVKAATHVDTLNSLLRRTRYERWTEENNKRRRSAEEAIKESRGKLGRYDAEKQADEKHGGPLPDYDSFHESPSSEEDIAAVKYPYPRMWQSDLRQHAEQFADVPGLKKIAATLKKAATEQIKFQGSVNGMKASGGSLVSPKSIEEQFEGKLLGVDPNKKIRVHASWDWRLAQASQSQGGRNSGQFYTADKGKTWSDTPEKAALVAYNKNMDQLDLVDAPEDKLVTFDDPKDIEAMQTAARRLRRSPRRDLQRVGENLNWQLEDYKRLQSMDIKSPAELRAALREYLPLRAGVDREDPVKKMERALRGRKIEGFFPTPKPLIDKMLDVAGIEPGHSVLEPSAGKGDILDAVRERQPEAQTEAIEPVGDLRSIIEAKGHKLAANDFLSHKGAYDRIVMNPPFEKGADIDHVRHAYDQLKPGGRLVAIMSEGPFSRSDKKAEEFRNWLDENGGEHEQNPEGSFSGGDAFRQTGVSTRLVTINKPAAEQYSRRFDLTRTAIAFESAFTPQPKG